MELKPSKTSDRTNNTRSLNRTFYGIETFMSFNRMFYNIVLIVPFMELKRC